MEVMSNWMSGAKVKIDNKGFEAADWETLLLLILFYSLPFIYITYKTKVSSVKLLVFK